MNLDGRQYSSVKMITDYMQNTGKVIANSKLSEIENQEWRLGGFTLVARKA